MDLRQLDLFSAEEIRTMPEELKNNISSINGEHGEQNFAISTMYRPDLPTMFSDNIDVDDEGEVVIFNFCQTLPGWAKQQTDAREILVKQAPVFARIAVTRAHFERLVSVCQDILSKMESSKHDK